jgi:ABC-type Na+ transport system ATPase subunit NatA
MDNISQIKEMKGVFEKPEKTREAILTLINTIKTNKTFSKLIIYSLNTLKNFLTLSNQVIVIENSTTILNGISKFY